MLEINKLVTEKENQQYHLHGSSIYQVAKDRIWDTRLSEFTLSLMSPADFLSWLSWALTHHQSQPSNSLVQQSLTCL